MKYKIIFDVDKCIGCESCCSICPSNWKMKKTKANPVKTELDEIGNNKGAEEYCPVGAIKIVRSD